MTAVVQVLVDVLAIVGAWHCGGYAGRAIVHRRRRHPPAEIPYGAVPVTMDEERTRRMPRRNNRDARHRHYRNPILAPDGAQWKGQVNDR